MPSRRPGIISADAIAKNGGARKIRLNRRSVTGYVPSRKTGALIPHESTLERDAIILYDGDPNVRSVIAQPLHIVGNGRTYTPDLLVEYNDGVELKEIKYQDDLDANWELLEPRMALGARHALDQGWEFDIDTERTIRTTRLENLNRLWRYRSINVPDDERRSICAIVASHGPCGSHNIVQMLTNDTARQLELLTSVWGLLASGELQADIDQEPLTNSTWLRLP